MKAKVTIGIALFLLGGAFHAFAQATAYANIYACVVAPIGFTKTADLSFSDANVSKSSNTIEITSDNSGNASDIEMGSGGTTSLATFVVSNRDHLTFDVTLPTEAIQIGDNNSNIMTINNFTSANKLTGSFINGSREIKVAATLHMPENQVAGNFYAQNPFPVTINYN